jgi:hypothetical protein
MRYFTFSVLLALIAAMAFAGDLSREAKVERILDATNAKAAQEQMMAQMKQMAAQQMSASLSAEQKAKAADFQNRMFDIISNRMSWEKTRPMIVKVWGETFTDQELDGMLAFYESPSGRAMVQKMPSVVMKMMQQVQSIMGDIQPEIEKMLKEQGAK